MRNEVNRALVAKKKINLQTNLTLRKRLSSPCLRAVVMVL